MTTTAADVRRRVNACHTGPHTTTTRSISVRRTAQTRDTRRKPRRLHTRQARFANVEPCPHGLVSKGFLSQEEPDSAGQQQHGRCRPSAAQATVSIQECTHSGAMERVLSDSPRTTMKNRPRPRCARTTRNGGKGTKGRYYYDDVDATTSKVDRACTRVTRTSKPLRDDGVGTKKPRWPASNHANESYQSLSSPIARDEQTTNEAHLQPTSLQPSFFYCR